jgi:hypothetical protein
VERNQDPEQKGAVFWFQWQGKPIDNTTKRHFELVLRPPFSCIMHLPSEDFQELGNAVKLFRFIDELEENMIDGFPNKRPQTQELAINAMQRSLEKVPFPRIFTIKQFQELFFFWKKKGQ